MDTKGFTSEHTGIGLHSENRSGFPFEPSWTFLFILKILILGVLGLLGLKLVSYALQLLLVCSSLHRAVVGPSANQFGLLPVSVCDAAIR